MESLTIPWIGKDRSQRQVRGTNQGGGKLGLSSILMGAHTEDTVVPNFLLGALGFIFMCRLQGLGRVKARRLLPFSCLRWRWLCSENG